MYDTLLEIQLKYVTILCTVLLCKFTVRSFYVCISVYTMIDIQSKINKQMTGLPFWQQQKKNKKINKLLNEKCVHFDFRLMLTKAYWFSSRFQKVLCFPKSIDGFEIGKEWLYHLYTSEPLYLGLLESRDFRLSSELLQLEFGQKANKWSQFFIKSATFKTIWAFNK